MNVVQQLPQPQHLNIMDLSIFPDSLNLNKVSREELTLESVSGEAAKTKYLLTLT